MHPTRSFTFSCLASIILVGLGGQAFSSTVAVGTCTSLINFATIQLAVNSVPAGSTIKVCPGTYPEQVVINKKLNLQGIPNSSGSQDAAVILPPAGGVLVNTTDQRGAVAAQVLVQNTAGPVLISDLTVDGKGNQYSGDDLRGICYQDASGVVDHVAVRNEIPNDIPTGDQSGQGIMVENDKLTRRQSDRWKIVPSINYDNGIVARYAGATLTATGTTFRGPARSTLLLKTASNLPLAVPRERSRTTP